MRIEEKYKAKLARRKTCNYCGKKRPRFRPTPYGLERLIIKLPNSLWQCVACAIEKSKTPTEEGPRAA